VSAAIESQATPTDSAATAGQLPRLIGAGTMAAVVIGTIIGSGIFRTPAAIAAEMGSIGGIALVWIAGGIVTLCLALSLAELATMYPRSGGLYVFLREAFGPGVAFVYLWTFLLVNPSNWAAISLIFAESLGRFVELTEAGKRLAAAALVVSVCAANYLSVRFAGRIQNVATTAKAVAVAAIALVIFALADGAGGALAAPASFAVPGFGAFGVALVAVLWPYEGVAGSCALAGEVRDPRRSLPRALVLSVLLVMVLYLAINAAYVYALPIEAVARSELVATDAMRAAVGPGAELAIAACIALSTFGAVAATSISDPRVFYASAREGLFFRATGAVHPRFLTPHVAIVFSGALAILYLSVRTFEELAAQFVLGMWLFYFLAVVGLVVLRIRRPAAERPYRVPLYPLVPAIVILGAGWLLLNSLIELPAISTINLALSAAGIPVYWLWTRLRRPRP
jgi:APA family basic amino acid/polyamine antiporter